MEFMKVNYHVVFLSESCRVNLPRSLLRRSTVLYKIQLPQGKKPSTDFASKEDLNYKLKNVCIHLYELFFIDNVK